MVCSTVSPARVPAVGIRSVRHSTTVALRGGVKSHGASHLLTSAWSSLLRGKRSGCQATGTRFYREHLNKQAHGQSWNGAFGAALCPLDRSRGYRQAPKPVQDRPERTLSGVRAIEGRTAAPEPAVPRPAIAAGGATRRARRRRRGARASRCRPGRRRSGRRRTSASCTRRGGCGSGGGGRSPPTAPPPRRRMSGGTST